MSGETKPTERAMRAAVNLEVQEPWLTSKERTAAEEFDKSFPAYDDMLAALKLGVEYDNLLLRFKGPKVIFDGDVAEIDAAYDKWVAATRAAVAKAEGPRS